MKRKFVPALPAFNWLMLATSTEKDRHGNFERPALTRPHGNWSTDGFRMYHILGDENKVVCDCPHCQGKDGKTPDFTQVLTDAVRKKYQVEFGCDRDELLAVCNAFDAASKKGERKNSLITFRASEGIVNFHAFYSDTGRVTDSIKCDPNGVTDPAVTISLKFSFLRDALVGFNSPVTLRYVDEKHPVYLTDGEREALVMTCPTPKESG